MFAYEINKLFSTDYDQDQDIFHPQPETLMHYPLSPTYNTWSSAWAPFSSSPETSPESYPELYQRYPEKHQIPEYLEVTHLYKIKQNTHKHCYHESDFTLQGPLYSYATPLVPRHRHDIIGRRINLDYPMEDILDQTVNSPTEPSNDVKSYELFPREESPFKYTSVKTSRTRNVSCTSLDASSVFDLSSRVSDTASMSEAALSPALQESPESLCSPKLLVKKGTAAKKQKPVKDVAVCQNVCTFCRKNGETPFVYLTHTVKERIGGKHIVTCPILRSLVCTTCGATGDKAHTLTHCPVNRRASGHKLLSTTVSLRSTRMKSNGMPRCLDIFSELDESN